MTTKADAFEAIARSLREFGYLDTTADMVRDCWTKIEGGHSEEEMPHGIVGRFAYSQLNENRSWIKKLR
jgi:hypothetical protein